MIILELTDRELEILTNMLAYEVEYLENEQEQPTGLEELQAIQTKLSEVPQHDKR